MTVLYVESSAVLSWLLGEPGHEAILEELSRGDVVVTSILTLVECSRALTRARVTKRLTQTEEMAVLRMLDQVAASWNLLDISDRVAQRARNTFPTEPVRTLDAIHLASMLIFAEALGSLRVLSLDDRVRANVSALGMSLAPA